MALSSVRNCVAINSILRQLPILFSAQTVRSLKTTTTEHPKPVYDQDEKVLEKVLQNRNEDLPDTMKNPYEKERRKCVLCEHNIIPNYKNVKLLYQFVSPYTGLVYGRHITGLCKAQQKILEREIQKARGLALMATYLKQVEFLKDPKLCDPERPLRPHPH